MLPALHRLEKRAPDRHERLALKAGNRLGTLVGATARPPISGRIVRVWRIHIRAAIVGDRGFYEHRQDVQTCCRALRRFCAQSPFRAISGDAKPAAPRSGAIAATEGATAGKGLPRAPSDRAAGRPKWRRTPAPAFSSTTKQSRSDQEGERLLQHARPTRKAPSSRRHPTTSG